MVNQGRPSGRSGEIVATAEIGEGVASQSPDVELIEDGQYRCVVCTSSSHTCSHADEDNDSVVGDVANHRAATSLKREANLLDSGTAS